MGSAQSIHILLLYNPRPNSLAKNILAELIYNITDFFRFLIQPSILGGIFKQITLLSLTLIEYTRSSGKIWSKHLNVDFSCKFTIVGAEEEHVHESVMCSPVPSMNISINACIIARGIKEKYV